MASGRPVVTGKTTKTYWEPPVLMIVYVYIRNMYIIMREWLKSPISSRASPALKNTIYDVELMIIFYYIIIIIFIIIIIIIICKSSKRDYRIYTFYLPITRAFHTKYGNGRDSVLLLPSFFS